MMLLIGSQALRSSGKEYLPSLKGRFLDYDFICTFHEYKNWVMTMKSQYKIVSYPETENKIIAYFDDRALGKVIYEFEIAWEGSSGRKLLEIIKEHPELVRESPQCLIATANLVYTLKMSHRYLKNSPHFLKTMRDIKHMRKMECKIPEVLSDWFKDREKETYSYNHPKLDTSKDMFFKDDGVPYLYDHDTIHESMKHLDKPAYEYYKPEDKEVFCSKKMFFECDEMIRLYGVAEEAYVLALERSQIPATGVWTPRKSFEYALMKVCTSITSGWFREYAWENYEKVLELYDDSYVDRFWKAVERGIVKKISFGNENIKQ